jgi:small subunit ribosomal protein S8
MSMQDILSDFVARINNSLMISNPTVVVIKSKLIINICKWMTRYGFFTEFEEYKDFYLKIKLNLDQIKKLKRISKPGQRVYCKSGNYPVILDGKGFTIISTSKGLYSNYELVKNNLNLGGEVLFQIIKL